MYDCGVRSTLSALVFACVACSRGSAPTAKAAESTPAEVDAAVAAIDAGSAAPLESVDELVARWNAAHDRHDADALARLYAASVDFYDAELANAEVVKRKRDALTAAPDYTQKLSEIESAPVDGNGGVFVRFKKTTTSHGRAKSYFGFLYVIGGRIVAEGDRDPVGTEISTRYVYCYDSPSGLKINDVRVGVFKVSALEALLAIEHSKAFADLKAGTRGALTLAGPPGCAHGCSPGDFGTCNEGDIIAFTFMASVGNTNVAGFTVHPITKVVTRVPLPTSP